MLPWINKSLTKPRSVSFEGEVGIDAGGLLRNWWEFPVFSKALGFRALGL